MNQKAFQFKIYNSKIEVNERKKIKESYVRGRTGVGAATLAVAAHH